MIVALTREPARAFDACDSEFAKAEVGMTCMSLLFMQPSGGASTEVAEV